MNSQTHVSSFLNKLFKNMLIFLPLGVIGNLLFSYYHSDSGLITYLGNISGNSIALCLILCMIPWFTHSLRILIWTRFITKKIAFKEILKIAVAADLGAAISPTSVGGGPLKAGMLMQQGLKTSDAISLTLLGSVEDHTFFFLSVPIAFVITAGWKHHFFGNIVHFIQSSNCFLFIAGTFLGTLIIGLLNKKRLKRVGKKLNRFAYIQKATTAVRNMFSDISSVYQLIGKKGKRLIVLSLMLTAIHWISRYSILIVLLYGLGFDIHPVKIFFLQWIILVLMLFVPTPGATGGAEASFYFIFRNIIPDSTIGFIMPAWRFLTYYATLGLGTIFFTMLNFIKVKKPTEERQFSALELN